MVELLVLGMIMVASGLATAYAAVERGRNPTMWFVVGALAPFVGLALVFILAPSGAHAARTAHGVIAPSTVVHSAHGAGAMCPDCGEAVPTISAFCMFCGAQVATKDEGVLEVIPAGRRRR